MLLNFKKFNSAKSLPLMIDGDRVKSIKALLMWGIFLCSATFFHYNSLLSTSSYEAPTLTVEAQPAPAHSATISKGQQLASLVKKTVSTLHYSAYKLGGAHFDAKGGVYIVDCSRYVDYLVKTVSPRAYSSLVNSTGAVQPNSKNYYDFFNRLSSKALQNWKKVESVSQLQPGDILVWCLKGGPRHGAAGHIMVVMDKPVHANGGMVVSVADSAPVGHSQDTRPSHKSGIGIGTLVLKVNPNTGKPDAYAWRKGSSFKNNVNFAMARPVEVV